MREFFIVANSFSAPFFSDQSTSYAKGTTAKTALEAFAKNYDHPAGLYAAQAYATADKYHKGEKPLASWVCNHEIKKQELTKNKGSHSYLGHAPGDFEIDGKRYKIGAPKQGRVV